MDTSNHITNEVDTVILPVNPASSLLSWNTLRETQVGMFCFRLQEQTQFLMWFPNLLNKKYRVTWGHILRYASSDSEIAIGQCFDLLCMEWSRCSEQNECYNSVMQNFADTCNRKFADPAFDVTKTCVAPSTFFNTMSSLNLQLQLSILRPVFYVTNRSPIVGGNDLNYSNISTNMTFYGICDTTFANHDKNAQLTCTSVRLYKECVVDTVMRHYEWDNTTNLNAAITTSVSTYTDSKAKNNILIYLHGYNTLFKDAIVQAGRLALDIDFPGTVLVYSFSSCGQPDQYYADCKIVDTEYGHLVSVLEDLMHAKQGFAHVSIFAHSLGNRLMYQAFGNLGKRLKHDMPQIFFNVISCGANIPHELYLECMDQCYFLSKKWFVYIHKSDHVLGFAQIIQGRQLGQSPPTGYKKHFSLGGVYFVDTDQIGFEGLNFRKNHSLFKHNKPVLINHLKDVIVNMDVNHSPGCIYTLTDSCTAPASGDGEAVPTTAATIPITTADSNKDYSSSLDSSLDLAEKLQDH